MKNLSTDATRVPPSQLVLNVTKLNELRRAHEMDSDSELAKQLGVDRSTLYRVIAGGAPSNVFMARMQMLFPSVPLGSLFVVDRLQQTLQRVAS